MRFWLIRNPIIAYVLPAARSTSITYAAMQSSGDLNGSKETGPTTNAHDKLEASRLKERLKEGRGSQQSYDGCATIPAVHIDEGSHKYVQITADQSDGNRATFVVSKRGAAYHRNAAEPFVELLEESGYLNIEIDGGGRIFRDDESKSISIFGYSYGFGQANHAISKAVVEAQKEFADYNVTWSNEGY